jgi:hypothetical protein
MKQKLTLADWSLMLVVVSALCLSTIGVALAEGTWVDEIANAVAFYKGSNPASNFEPYLQTLGKVREGLVRGDQQIVKIETDRFLKMLLARSHGINDVVADELYNFAVSVRPSEGPSSTASIELGIGSERPMAMPQLGIGNERLLSVPIHIRQTRDDGRSPCTGFKDGCDYWVDFMDDNSGG